VRRSEFLAGIATAASARPARGRTLRLDANPLGHDIDPYRDPESGIDELAWLYADGLVGWDGHTVPLLAASLPAETDGGRRLHYRLRRADWHDGRRFVARDVADALESIRATRWGTSEPYRSIRELVVEGDHDFDVILDSPRPGFVRSFFGPYGTPALPLVRRAPDGMPLGTGPFAVRARPELQRWRLERYNASPRGSPRLDAIELRLLSSDMSANVRLLSGEADIALPLTPNAFGTDRFRRLRRITSTAVLILNADRTLHDVAARRAFAHAIDVPSLQRAYDRKRMTLLASLLLSGGNDARFARALAFDRSTTAALRGAVADRELTIVFVTESPAQTRMATLLQQTLLTAGVASALRPAPTSRYTSLEGPLRSGAFDIAVVPLTYGDDPDFEADWSCDSRPPAGGNFARWCEPGFESAIRRGERRAALRMLYDTIACIPLSRAYEDLGISPPVRGFVAPPLLVPATYSCTRWELD